MYNNLIDGINPFISLLYYDTHKKNSIYVIRLRKITKSQSTNTIKITKLTLIFVSK